MFKYEFIKNDLYEVVIRQLSAVDDTILECRIVFPYGNDQSAQCNVTYTEVMSAIARRVVAEKSQYNERVSFYTKDVDLIDRIEHFHTKTKKLILYFKNIITTTHREESHACDEVHV